MDVVVRFASILISFFPESVQSYAGRLRSSPLGYRLARGAFWCLIGAVISRGLALVASIAVARILGKEGFGELGIIQSTIGMFQAFAGFGLGLTATKYVAEYRLNNVSRAGRIIALSEFVAVGTGFFMAILLFVFATWLATHTLAAPHLAGLLRISASLLFLGAVSGAQTGILSGFESFKVIARINLIVGIVAFPLMIGGVYWKGLQGAVWGLAVSIGINCFLNHLAVRAETRKANIPLIFSDCWQEWKNLFSFSLPALLANVMVGPVMWACNVMLVNQPNGYMEMGVFNAANQWFAALMFLPVVMGQPVIPILSEQLGRHEHERCSKILATSVKLNSIIVMPLIIMGCILSPVIMGLYGDNYRDAWPTLAVVLLTAGLLAIQTPIGYIVAASNRMWMGFAMNMGWAITFVCTTVYFVRWGAIGLASARAISYIVHATWTFAFGYYVIHKKWKKVC